MCTIITRHNNSQALDRLAVLEVATADARAESAEQQSRLETLARDVRALTKSYLKIRGELNDFQARVSFDKAELGCEDGEIVLGYLECVSFICPFLLMDFIYLDPSILTMIHVHYTL